MGMGDGREYFGWGYGGTALTVCASLGRQPAESWGLLGFRVPGLNERGA